MSDLFAVFGVEWKLLIAQIINFAVLLAVLTYLLYRPVMKVLDERQRTIADGVRNAEAADRQLADAQEASNGIKGNATREAEGIVAAARVRADERAAEIVRVAEERASAALKDATLRAEEAKRDALKKSEQEIARVAMLAAEKILRQKSA